MWDIIDLPQWFYRAAWIVWGLSFFVIETLALLDADQDDTLTELVRPVVQARPIGYFLGGALILWLFWHFIVERSF